MRRTVSNMIMAPQGRAINQALATLSGIGVHALHARGALLLDRRKCRPNLLL